MSEFIILAYELVDLRLDQAILVVQHVDVVLKCL